MIRTTLILLALVGLAMFFWWSRSPHGYFRTPLDRSLDLAANFGELREGHFHMGLDIRTGGREGLPVYAAANGYVSHLSIQPDGMGKALFITHPNGLVTVYGHLQHFTDPLESLIRQEQYTSQSWQQEVDIKPGFFPINKGTLIAYSGNTGASLAPHLHFEMRNATTGANINPQLQGMSVDDDIPPSINNLYWYDRRYSTYMTKARKIAIRGRDGHYHTMQPIVRLNSPLVSLGISATDKSSASSHISGIFASSLWLDDSLIHAFSLSGLAPSDTRYINACIDYSKWIRSGIYVQHLSTLPGNRAPIFTAGRDGVIRLHDTLVHVLRIRVTDVQNNPAELNLHIQYLPGSTGPSSDPVLFHTIAFSAGRSFSSGTLGCLPGKESLIKGASFAARFSPSAFYDQLPFHWQELPDTDTRSVSPLIYLHDPTVPVHDRFPVRIRTSLPQDAPLRSRVVMQLISGDSQYIVKGSWQGNWMCGFFRRLGILRLLIDTVAPTVSSYQWEEGRPFSQNSTDLSIQSKDDLGPIASFRGEIDGHWVPFAQKGNIYTYTFDATCPPGTHKLTITVADVAGNVTRSDFNIQILN